MPHNNPLLLIQIRYPLKTSEGVDLMRVLMKAGVVTHHPSIGDTYLLNPPKGANNQWWAEHTYLEIGKAFPNLPCKIVRPEENASELATAQPHSIRHQNPTLTPRDEVAKMSREELEEAVRRMRMKMKQDDNNSYLRGQNKELKRLP